MGDNIIEAVAEMLGAVGEGIKDGLEDAEAVEELRDMVQRRRALKRKRALVATAQPAPASEPATELDPLAQVLATVERVKGHEAAESLRHRIEAKVANQRYANFVSTLPVLAPATGRARHRGPHPSDGYSSDVA